jgi:hypothetical protein
MVLPHVLYRDGWIERESRRIDTTPETASVKKRETAVFPYLGHLNFRLKTMEVFFLNPKKQRNHVSHISHLRLFKSFRRRMTSQVKSIFLCVGSVSYLTELHGIAGLVVIRTSQDTVTD